MIRGSRASGRAESGSESLELAGAHVAILGWAGSTERQLRGVAGWYAARGARPFTVRARIFRNMARPDGWRREGAELALRVRDRLRRTDAPLLVHLFSNAGFWTLAALLRELDEDERARIRAAVIDSAPGIPAVIEPRFYADGSARAMMPMVLRALGERPALTHPVLTPPLRAFMRLWYHLSYIQIREAEESLELVRARSTWPQLYLYSDADALVPHALVEAFLSTLERPAAHRFEGSAHVLHMLRHRGPYFARIARFLDEALGAPIR